jgi:hypothetical protein
MNRTNATGERTTVPPSKCLPTLNISAIVVNYSNEKGTVGFLVILCS